MHPAGYSGPPKTAPSGAYGNSGAGFHNGNYNAPPYRQPPPQQQMTPQQRERVLLVAGRLAAEYLVSKGELSPHVLQNRPPAPFPFPFQDRRPAPRPQHDQTFPRPSFQQERPLAKEHFQPRPRHDQTFPRPFQQDRPLAREHFQFRPPAPRQFQQRPFAPRPFQGQGRPIAKRPRPSFQGRHYGAAPSAGSLTQRDLNEAPAVSGNDCQPVAQSDVTAQTQSPQMDQPKQG